MKRTTLSILTILTILLTLSCAEDPAPAAKIAAPAAESPEPAAADPEVIEPVEPVPPIGGCNDADGDGYGVGVNCDGPDCNDADGSINPGAVEIPCDGIDQDCDGADLRDGDGDGHTDMMADVGTADDCDDMDPDNWASCEACVDWDNDGWFHNCDVYVMRAGPDCHDWDESANEAGDCVPPGAAWPIPDTAGLYCQDYDSTAYASECTGPLAGQDSDYTINPPSYSLEGFGGEAVLDLITSLIWEIKPAGELGVAYDLEGALGYCRRITRAGLDNWRVPSPAELQSIADYYHSGTEPTAFQLAFPANSEDVPYWAFEQFQYDRDGGSYNLWFFRGEISNQNADHENLVRCVSGAPAGDLPRDYLIIDSGQVEDRGAGLVWMRSPPPSKFDFHQAVAYCNELVVGGFDGWRLANVKELFSLVDPRIDSGALLPAVDVELFPGVIQSAAYYWSSTVPGCQIRFGSQQVDCGISLDWETNAICVRGGE